MTQTVATLVHSGTLGSWVKGLIPWAVPSGSRTTRVCLWQHRQALPSLCGTCRGLPWTLKGLGPMGLVTLFLQGMGPPLTNELGYNGKKAEASEGAQRPHTACLKSPQRARERSQWIVSCLLLTISRHATDGMRICSKKEV